MRDSFEREIDYLRVSLTNACNLRCIYCRPSKDGCQNKNSLTKKAYLQLVPLIASACQIKKIRLTGGEPLLYPHLAELISAFKKLPNVKKIALTTNGILLAAKLEQLKQNGLDEVNISLDSVDSEQFARITRGGSLPDVIHSIKKARLMDIPVKLNSVIIKGINERQILPLVQLAQAEKIPLRFIELMPFGTAAACHGVNETQIRQILSAHFGQLQAVEKADSGPAHYITAENFTAPIGFISTLSHNFCAQCSRIRLTSDGILRPCLLNYGGTDLLSLLKQNASDDIIKKAVKECVLHKPQRCQLINGSFELAKCNSMAQIGG